MKTFNSILTLGRTALLFTVGALLVFGAIFTTPVTTALAAPAAPPTDALLSRRYKLDQAWLNGQATNLNKAADLVTAIQSLITEAQARSIDTTSLEAALAAYQSQLTTAGASHTSAANLLAAHAGFDANGKVTSRPAASQTVHSATQALKDAHGLLVSSTRSLLGAVIAFETTNQLFTQIDLLQVEYANEQAWLGLQANNLTRAGAVVTNVQALITAAQAHGLDTSALSNGLTVFQSQLATAQAAHAAADSILASHTGFDDSGSVGDSTAAAQTVQDARQSLLDAHTALAQSTSDLLKVLNLWRVAQNVTVHSPVYAPFMKAYRPLQLLHNLVIHEGKARFFVLDTRLTNLLNALLKELQS